MGNVFKKRNVKVGQNLGFGTGDVVWVYIGKELDGRSREYRTKLPSEASDTVLEVSVEGSRESCGFSPSSKAFT